MSPSPSPSPGTPEKIYSREANAVLPSDTTDLYTIYTTPEENDVYAFDGRRVDVVGDSGTYLLHLFKKTNDNREDQIKVRAVVRSSNAPAVTPVYLQIWNGTTLLWETIDSDLATGANIDFSLDAVVEVNNSNYYDFANQVAIRVYQPNTSGLPKTLSIDQIVISFIAQYSNTYETVGNKYIELYPTTNETEYAPKYPSKNPQDDL